MIKAELSYNPYLVETNIRFNGQAPRINSLVEKYQHTPFPSWIKQVPAIFYDEMNGFYFELDFSGTALDYSELKLAFAEAGVSEEEVHIFHKNELNSRESKLKDLDLLLDWLLNHPNRNFAFDEFKKENDILFESAYPFILVNGSDIDVSMYDGTEIFIENVDNLKELTDTDLTNTPLLFYLRPETMNVLKDNIKTISARKDVKPEQIFFMINPSLDTSMVKRIIKDLGINAPQLVKQADDIAIKKYIELYPFTDYICQSIQLFREVTSSISCNLEEIKKKSEISNKAVYIRIKQLNNIIEKLKTANNLFINKDNLEMPNEWQNIKQNMISSILQWKIRKTKMTKEDEALTSAYELNEKIHEWFSLFEERLNAASLTAKANIKDNLSGWYASSEFDPEYIPQIKTDHKPSVKELSVLTEKLMQLKEEAYVTPKDNLIGLFVKSSNQETKEPVLQTTYHYQKWREYAIEAITPILDDCLKEHFEIIGEYFNELSDAYSTHIEDLIKKETTEKEKVFAQLSDDELKLQEDSDWLIQFMDQLQAIERG